jgi:Thiol:disulfide interchange protein DsbD, N-terminal
MRISRLTPSLALAALVFGLGTARPTGQSFLRNQPPRITTEAAVSTTEVSAGDTFTVTVRITPLPDIHVYAPGNPEYIPVSLSWESRPALRFGEAAFPKAEDYFFAPLKEVVKVYSKPFTVTQPVTVADTPQGKEAKDSVSLTGTVGYQACDDRVCFPPQSATVTTSIRLKRERR